MSPFRSGTGRHSIMSPCVKTLGTHGKCQMSLDQSNCSIFMKNVILLNNIILDIVLNAPDNGGGGKI